ncbi:similar to Saccharomyces cerevisiae YGL082W Putative protein of unknown function [Maudiozyma saulgeensis]|uniref:MINDY deubiquitinase domain-containing protein n=1 Tax=Maudiozyma saulgeensis TaxID=1789683 RepID=A0A1X7R7T6_9SACH|nr:similar to Saccharomyces cerevisiae YGL082W Putative protein of unknown function [Kazachstania saulgeensis]
MCVRFVTKAIEYENRKCCIILQNENGPCALIALVNVLLLDPKFENITGDLKTLVNDSNNVELEDILQAVASIALYITDNNLNTTQTIHGSLDVEYLKDESDMSKLFAILPSLNAGLNVNPNFDGTFENSAELALFRLFGVPLVHGWIMENDHNELSKLSYDEALNVVAHAEELCDDTEQHDTTNDTCVFEKATILKAFLNNSSTQLTSNGIQYLIKTLSNNSLSVLFRNDHFATILKRDDILYTLITDLGYSRQPSIIWESLMSIDSFLNDFCDSHFRKSEAIQEDISADKEMNDKADEVNSIDRKIALQLQEEEDRIIAESMNKSLNKRVDERKLKPPQKSHKKKIKHRKDTTKHAQQLRTPKVSRPQHNSTASNLKSSGSCIIT